METVEMIEIKNSMTEQEKNWAKEFNGLTKEQVGTVVAGFSLIDNDFKEVLKEVLFQKIWREIQIEEATKCIESALSGV